MPNSQHANERLLPDQLPEFVMMKDVLKIVNKLFKESLGQDEVHYVLDCSSVRDFSGEALAALSKLRRFHLHENQCELTLRGCNERMAEITKGPCFRALMNI